MSKDTSIAVEKEKKSINHMKFCSLNLQNDLTDFSNFLKDILL